VLVKDRGKRIACEMNTIGILKNPIQEYAWGSLTAIPELLGTRNRSNKPQAELWMGAHPKAPSEVEYDGKRVSLLELIDRNPEAILGKRVAQKFDNRLPYLFKVLAAAKPLSIQAHPNLQQARQGFELETTAGISLDAPHRNYRDANHKPECICALTPFWALCGFRKISDLIAYFEAICAEGMKNELAQLANNQDTAGLRRFFTFLMALDGDQRKKIISEAKPNIHERRTEDPVFEWILRLLNEYPDDIGIFSPIFLNLICLEPGQALFLAAGQLHAYLDGVGIELMANSDNVLRGGLTAKHIDVPELLRILQFDEFKVEILNPKNRRPCEFVYPSPVEEFVLSTIELKPNVAYKSEPKRSVEILLCTAGAADFIDTGRHNTISIKKGMAVIVPAVAPDYEINGKATFYKASVPSKKPGIWNTEPDL